MIESPPSRHGRLNALIGVCSVALLAPLFGPLLTGRVFVNNDLCVVPPADAVPLSAGAAVGRLRAVDAVDLRRTVSARRRAGRPVPSVPSIAVPSLSARGGIQSRADRQLPGGVRRNVLVPPPPAVQPRGGALRRHAVRVQRLQPAAPPSHQHGGRRRAHAVAAGRRRRADRGRAEAGANARVRGNRADPRVRVPARISTGRVVERDDACGVRRVPRRRNATVAATCCRAPALLRSASCWAESSCCRRRMPRRTRRGWGYPATSR